MVRRQTRVQKRNRRQKTKRNNRRENKTLRRKRQSRRKEGGSTENPGQGSIHEPTEDEIDEKFIKREARILGVSVHDFKECKEFGLYKNSAEDDFMKDFYGNVLQFSVYSVLAKQYKDYLLKNHRIDRTLTTERFIRAIDEAKLLGMNIEDFLKENKSLAYNPFTSHTSSLHRKKCEVLNKIKPELNLVKKPDGYEKIKDEAKILGITIDSYIDLYKEANSVDHLIRKVDEKKNNELGINDEVKYVEMKTDAKETGLTLSEVKEAIKEATKRGKDKKIVFAEKMNMPFFDNKKWKELLREEAIDEFKMPNLNTLRINYDDHIAKQKKKYEHEAFEKKQKGYASSIARSPSSSTGSSQATKLATSMGYI